VKYWSDPKNVMTATGITKTYTKGGWNGWLHYVKLNNLTPGTKYGYHAGDGTYFSMDYGFTTEPLTKPPQRTVKIANVGDMGANMTESGNTMMRLKNLVSTGAIDWILHDGDIGYADGYQGQWDKFFREMESVTANIPYMVTPGNHEIGVIGELGLAIGYIHRFLLPGDHSTTSDLANLYYSFDYANIHFIALDSESVIDTTEFTNEQRDWLQSDLASVNRTKTPWIIAYAHRPFYCSSNPECDKNPFILEEAIKLFNEYQVDLVFSAHRHNYERMWPITQTGAPVKTYNNPGAPVYILNGAGGNREGTSGFNAHIFPGSVTRIAEWGYGIIEVFNNTVLQYTFYNSATNAVLDNVVLVAHH